MLRSRLPSVFFRLNQFLGSSRVVYTAPVPCGITAMQSLYAQRPAVLDSHFGRHSNCPKDDGATRQLWSIPKPARQRGTLIPLQPCNAFLPWQRAQQPAPPIFPAQDGMQLTEEATAQQQLGYGDGQAVASLINLSEESLRSPVTAVPAEPTFPRGPIIGGSGGGIFFFWQLGTESILCPELFIHASSKLSIMQCLLPR